MNNYDVSEMRDREATKPHRARVAKARKSLSRLDREALEAVAEAAIAMLDEMSDPDEDRCPAGDDGCGAFFGGERGGIHWGSKWEGEGDNSPPPTYGVDQREVLKTFGVAFRVD